MSDTRHQLHRDRIAYDEAIRRALEVRKAAQAHRRHRPIAFPANPPRPPLNEGSETTP